WTRRAASAGDTVAGPRCGGSARGIGVVKIVVVPDAPYSGVCHHDDLHDRPGAAVLATTIFTTRCRPGRGHDDLHDRPRAPRPGSTASRPAWSGPRRRGTFTPRRRGTTIPSPSRGLTADQTCRNFRLEGRGVSASRTRLWSLAFSYPQVDITINLNLRVRVELEREAM